MLVEDADVQVHLPVDKLKIEEIPDDLDQCKIDTERIIRGSLTGVIDSAVLATWVDADHTPDTIRAIAGRLCAAQIYRLRFGGSGTSDLPFAQNLYNTAMAMLNSIIAGQTELEGIDIGTDFSNEWFEPNDAVTTGPYFTMGARF